jgi:nicotinamidase-related amidase
MEENTPRLNPLSSILLVLDYQAGIVSSLPEAFVTRMSRIIDEARRAGMQVGYVRVALTEAEHAEVPETNKSFSSLGAGWITSDDAPGTAIHSSVAPRPGDMVVRKTRVGAFSTTDLDKQLRALGIDTVLLAGVSTSGVVLSTVRDAADRDYRIYVIEDACADRDPEVHDVLMRKVFPRQAWVVQSAELSQLLETQ